MFHLHPGAFGIGPEDPGEDRERMHRIALRDARIAHDHHTGTADDVALARELQRAARLRLATQSATTNGVADLAACCA